MLLRRGKGGAGTNSPSCAGVAQEQSRGEFASACATARAQDAALQIARISPALPLHSRRRPQHFQCPAPSHIPRARSESSETKRSTRGGLRPQPESQLKLPRFTPPIRVPVTAPSAQIRRRLLGHAGAEAARVNPFAVIPKIAQQQPAEMRSRAFRVGPSDDDEFLPIEAFRLAPSGYQMQPPSGGTDLAAEQWPLFAQTQLCWRGLCRRMKRISRMFGRVTCRSLIAAHPPGRFLTANTIATISQTLLDRPTTPRSDSPVSQWRRRSVLARRHRRTPGPGARPTPRTSCPHGDGFRSP